MLECGCYQPNLGDGRFGPLQTVAALPPLAGSGGGRHQFVDLAGDGLLDLAEFAGQVLGFAERTGTGDWAPFTTFRTLPGVDWADPNLRFVDLTGDGRADILLAEDDALTWYPSLAEDGFGPAQRAVQPAGENAGPRLVFADGTGSVYLADMSGEGLLAGYPIRVYREAVSIPPEGTSWKSQFNGYGCQPACPTSSPRASGPLW